MSATTTAVPSVRVIKTRPGGARVDPTIGYSALLRSIREHGLLRRRTDYYAVVFAVLVLATVATAWGFVLLGDSWYQLVIAGVLGVILTQFAFLAHEASHHQVFQSATANDRTGRWLINGVLGISYAWWTHKHNRHHTNPNVVGKDPDIEPDFIVFQGEDARAVTGPRSAVIRRQGYLFFPLLLLEGANLHLHSLRTVFGRRKIDRRPWEITTMSIRIVGYLAVVFLVLPPGLAVAFVGVQLAIFGLYMGASFAPNHKGMPQIPHDSTIDFLTRQVLTSRNIRGGAFMDVFMGGLNYQVEHHLFPNMARPNLVEAQKIVREYCLTHNIRYAETSLFASYGIVIDYLNRVGLAARDPFDCPMVTAFHHR